MIVSDNPGRIRGIINFVNEITADLPVQSGSVLRVPSSAYGNWGIYITNDNRNWLYSQSRKAYECEWAETDGSLNRLVTEASQQAGLGDVNRHLNNAVGRMAASAAISLVEDGYATIAVCDVGAGTGATSVSFLSAVHNALNSRPEKTLVELSVIEPSMARLDEAERNIAALLAGFPKKNMAVTIKPIRLADIDALGTMRGQHIIISSASIHHNAFNYHLQAISDALGRNGIFINGDWHDSLSHHPARIYPLLRELGASKEKLAKFAEFFDVTAEKMRKADGGLSGQAISANNQIFSFWAATGAIFARSRKECPIYFLEAHEPWTSRHANLRENGFCTEPAKLRMAFPGARAAHAQLRRIHGSSLGAVTVAMKA